MTVLWVAIAILTVVVVVQGIALLAIAREVALMARRVPQTEAVDIAGGPEVGSVVEDLTAEVLGGGLWLLSDEVTHPLLLLFVSSHCEPCRSLMRDLSRIQGDWSEYTIRPIVVGTAGDAEVMRREAGAWQGQILVDSASAMTGLEIPVTPFGLLLDGDRGVIGRGVVNGRDSAAALIEGRVRATTDADWHAEDALLTIPTTNEHATH